MVSSGRFILRLASACGAAKQTAKRHKSATKANLNINAIFPFDTFDKSIEKFQMKTSKG